MKYSNYQFIIGFFLGLVASLLATFLTQINQDETLLLLGVAIVFFALFVLFCPSKEE